MDSESTDLALSMTLRLLFRLSWPHLTLLERYQSSPTAQLWLLVESFLKSTRTVLFTPLLPWTSECLLPSRYVSALYPLMSRPVVPAACWCVLVPSRSSSACCPMMPSRDARCPMPGGAWCCPLSAGACWLLHGVSRGTQYPMVPSVW